MKIKTIFLFSMLLTGLLAGCLPAAPAATATLAPVPTILPPTASPQPPTEPPAPTPTLPAEAIEPQNLGLLRAVGQFSLNSPNQIIWAADSQSVAVTSLDGVTLFPANGRQKIGFLAAQSPLTVLDIASNARTAALSSDNLTIEIRDIPSGSLLQTIQVPAPFTSALFTPDGKSLAVSSADEIAVVMYDVSSGKQSKELRGFETAAPVYHFTFSPDGRKLVWIARATVQVMDMASGQFAPALGHEDFVNSLAVSPDGKLVATAAVGTLNDTITPIITLWDAATSQPLARLMQTELPTSLSFSPDSLLLASDQGQQVLLWDVKTQKLARSLPAAPDRINNVAFSPDGKLLAAAVQNGILQFYQVQ